jgi:RNA polymerase subunit RPABC4/transcription elongation factor Spt4
MTKQKKFRLKLLFQEFDLVSGTYTIGRFPWCNITLDDPLVSREHVRITVYDDYAVLDDLGSRNGTLVNSQPVFSNYRLNHLDRIRLGAHELVFLAQIHYPSTQLRPTGTLILCPDCRIPLPEGASHCPHCGSPLIPDRICFQCRATATAKDSFCPKCGSKFEGDDSTVPVEMGGSESGWTSKLIDEVITKALSVGRYEQAAKLIDGKIAGFDQSAKNGSFNVESLISISKLSLSIAAHLKDGDRVKRMMDRWCRHQAQMPKQLLDMLENATHGWYDIKPELQNYLAALQNSHHQIAVAPELENQLQNMIKATPQV